MNDRERIELLKSKLRLRKITRPHDPCHRWADEVLDFLDDPNPDTHPFSGFMKKGDKLDTG